MARQPRNNFSKSRIHHEDSPHFEITEDEVSDMIIFCEQRLHQRVKVVMASYENLSLYATRFEGKTYFALGHIRAFCKTVIAAVGEGREDQSAEMRLVARLSELSGRDVKSGAEIREIRLRQARGE